LKLLRALAVALAVLALGALVWIFARRVGWPFDLEWMEGGELCHALRLVEHQPIYAPPSIDFIPYLYTPFYPAILATLSHLFGLGYGLARVTSLLGFVGATVLGYVFARREGGSRATALCAMAIPAAAFVPTGAWYDLARPDSLFLGLTTAGLLVGWWKRRSHAGVIAAALLLIAAFFCKQTASPFMIALGLALLVIDWRKLVSYGATLVLVGVPLLWWLNHSSGGWFWTYVFKLHQQHDFYAGRAFLGTPLRLFLLLGPAALCVPWALSRERSPGLVYATFVACAGVGAACLGFGTQWAFTNAFIPGVFYPSIAIGAAAGRLVTARELPRLRPHVVYLLLAVSLALAPGALVPLAGRVTPRDWAMDRTTPTGYDPRPYLPGEPDRQRAVELINRLKTTPGDVLIPFHPFYGHLAGKKTFLHRMGVLDVGRAGLGAPRGLVEAIRDHRWSLVVMDNKIDGNWFWWPGLQQSYAKQETISGPRVFSGADTEPRYLLSVAPPPPPPTAPPPVLEREP
jgi:hypothetical protein